LNDPHVESISYTFVVSGEVHDFNQAVPWIGHLGDFEVSLADGTLEARPTVDFTDAASGRGALDPHLRVWEADLELTRNIAAEFRFQSAHVVDRAPAPGDHTVEVVSAMALAGSVAGNVSISHSEYPAPPAGISRETEWARRFRDRLRDFRTGRDRICVAAYWFANTIEHEFRPASETLNVSSKLLRELRKIGAVDDPVESRKAGGEKRSLTPDEVSLVGRALPALALRVAQIDGGLNAESVPRITKDLR
jgi:hypothetical protein